MKFVYPFLAVKHNEDGVQLIYWNYRQFKDIAQTRYASDPSTTLILHKGLADFFSGKSSGGKYYK